jgi:hypothetical protein
MACSREAVALTVTCTEVRHDFRKKSEIRILKKVTQDSGRRPSGVTDRGKYLGKIDFYYNADTNIYFFH